MDKEDCVGDKEEEEEERGEMTSRRKEKGVVQRREERRNHDPKRGYFGKKNEDGFEKGKFTKDALKEEWLVSGKDCSFLGDYRTQMLWERRH